MEKSFKSLIDKSKSVLILLPKNPYFDQVAAGLSLYLALENKLDVAISCPSDMVVEFNRLVGVQRITSDLGNKNLVLKFNDYNAENIERVSYDIENKEFRLTVIPKPQVTPPKKDQVQVSYSGVSADTVILVGGLNSSHFPALGSNQLNQAKLVHIGTQDFQGGQVISLAKPASSISEIIYEYIKELETNINQDMASNLLAGIHEGSRNFTHSEVTSNSFKTVAELMEKGGTHFNRSQSQKPSQTPQTQKNQPQKPAYQMLDNVMSYKKPEDVKVPEGKTESPQTQEKPKDEDPGPTEDDAPKSWLEPKVYKGTNIS